MDTRFLDSFVTVVDGGSIAEAARRLDLTAAAVAQRIRALEQEIGARLVSRSGRTVTVTEAGAALLGRARTLLRDVRDLRSAAIGDIPSGELTLGAMPTVITGILPDILVLLSQKYPHIDVRIVRDTSSVLYRKVLDGDLDAAFIVQPPFTIPKACGWHVLRDERLIVLTPASFRARAPDPILAREPFIRLDCTTWAGRLVDGYLRRARIRPRERFEMDDLEAIAVMVDRGLGVSLVPDWAPPWPEGLALARLPVAGGSFNRRIGLAWTRASVRLRLVDALLEQAIVAMRPQRNRQPKDKPAYHR